MHILHSPIPVNPAGLWELAEGPHELLFSKTALRGFELGLTLDYHLPSCSRGQQSLQSDLRKFLVAETKDLDTSELPKPVLKSKSDKYRGYSAMQKAIRRGDSLLGWRAAHALHASGDGSSMWRRLMVVGLEDVGIGDPYGAALVLLAVTDKALRAEVGDLKLIWYFVQRFAAAPKSRDLCDLDVWCEIGGHLDNPIGEMLWMGGEQLVNLAANPNDAFVNRLAAVYRLSGKFPKVTPHGNPPVDKGLRHFHKAVQLPPLFRYISTKGMGWAQSAMAMIMPLQWQMFCASHTAAAGCDPFGQYLDEVKIGGVYAASLDKHTWAGKAAIGKFCSHPSIQKWFEAHPWVDAKKSMERAVFYVEGAVLVPRLAYVGAGRLFWDILKDKLKTNGFKTFAEGMEFYKLVG